MGFTKRIQGLEEIPAKQLIPIGGTTYTAAQLKAIFQAGIEALKTLTDKEAEAKQAAEAFRNAKAVALGLETGLKQWAFAAYGTTSPIPSQLGFAPRKQAVRSVDGKKQAVAQAHATRKARHTLGPKAKLAIKGTVVVPTVPAVPETSVAN